MKRVFIGGSVLLATVVLLVGCGSSNPPASTATAATHTAYAGGDGAFGEDPVQPGEHSRERFMNAVNASEQAKAAQPLTSR